MSMLRVTYYYDDGTTETLVVEANSADHKDVLDHKAAGVCVRIEQAD